MTNIIAYRRRHKQFSIPGGPLSLVCVLPVLSVLGCVFYHEQVIDHGTPISEAAIKQLVIGRTGRSEVFKLLGPPHSIFRGQVELQQGAVAGVQPFGLGAYYMHLGNRFLTTLAERQYAVLYRFRQSTSSASATTVILVATGRQTVKISADELLLLFNQDNDLLEDVAYRKET